MATRISNQFEERSTIQSGKNDPLILSNPICKEKLVNLFYKLLGYTIVLKEIKWNN
jgi:hypothetical protein